MNLERQFGFEFNKEIIEEFKKNLFGYISKFKDDLDGLLKFLNKSSIAYTNVIRRELNLSIEQIRSLVSTLIQLNKIQGVWSKDHNKFLREDEVIRLVMAVDPRQTIKDVKKLVDLAEISADSIDVMRNILEKKGLFKTNKKDG